MAAVERSIFGFLGTLVVLSWALHEMVHLHELTRPAPPMTPVPPEPGGPAAA
jgi:hypothetical protein